MYSADLDPKFGSLSPGVMGYAGLVAYARTLRGLGAVARAPPPSSCLLMDDATVTYYLRRVHPVPPPNIHVNFRQ